MISQKGAVLQIALDVHVGLKFRLSKCFLLLPNLKCEFVFNPFLYCKSFCVGKIKCTCPESPVFHSSTYITISQYSKTQYKP